MTNLSNSSPNVPTVINEDYESYFKQEHLKYLCSQDWKNTENKFMRELKMHNVPGDIDHLLDYLRDEHVKCLEQFKSSGLSASIWEKSFVINEKRFDETIFIKKLYLVSDGVIDESDLSAFFKYYTLNKVIEKIIQEAVAQRNASNNGVFQVFINNGDVTFGKATEQTENNTSFHSEDILQNIIFNARLFDTNELLLELRSTIACAIDMGDQQVLYGPLQNKYTINPNVQAEWYYIEKAIEESEVARNITDVKFIDQIVRWFPLLFDLNTPEEMKLFKRKLAKSISAERKLWRHGRAKEVTSLRNMLAMQKQLGIDYSKVERMFNAAYEGLYKPLVTLKTHIEKDKSKHVNL